MAKQLYRIRWTAIKGGATGVGTGGYPEKEAQRYADELNKDNAGITRHTIELVVTET